MWQIKDPVLREQKRQEEEFRNLQLEQLNFLRAQFESIQNEEVPIECSLCNKTFKTYKNGVKHFNTKGHQKKKESIEKKRTKAVDKYLIPDIASLVNDFLPEEETFYQKSKNLDNMLIQFGKEYYVKDLECIRSRYKRGSNFHILLKDKTYTFEDIKDVVQPLRDIPNLRTYFYNRGTKTKYITLSNCVTYGNVIMTVNF